MMLEMQTTEFLDKLSSKDPVPGGGGASAAVGAMGAALGLMVANLTTGKKKYQEVEAEIQNVKEQLIALRDQLVVLTDRDAKAFEPLAAAYRMPRETKAEQEEKGRVMEAALMTASVVPMEIMETILVVMQLLQTLGEKGSIMAVSDVGAGILFSQAALEGASLNVFINTKLMKDEVKAQQLNEKAKAMIARGEELKDRVYHQVLGKII